MIDHEHKKILTIAIVLLVLALFFISGVNPFRVSKDLINFVSDSKQQETEQINNTKEQTTDFSFDIFLSNLPDANSSGYVVVNEDVPFFTEEEKAVNEPLESYSPLDSYGRCGSAIALVSKKGTMPENNDRTDISGIKPTGWKTINTKNKFNYILPDGSFYLFNRCHLLANCLCANDEYKDINNSEVNLITGTRQMNLAMKEYEESVAKYCETTGKSVLVRATPIFINDEPLARGILYEGYTVNNNDQGLQFCVYFFNNQENFEIDYSNSNVEYVPIS